LTAELFTFNGAPVSVDGLRSKLGSLLGGGFSK